MKLTRIVEVALNGDADKVEPAVRRAFYAMTAELDEQSRDWDGRINGLSAKMDSAVEDIKVSIREEFKHEMGRQGEEVKAVKRLLLGLTGTAVVGILTGVANILISM